MAAMAAMGLPAAFGGQNFDPQQEGMPPARQGERGNAANNAPYRPPPPRRGGFGGNPPGRYPPRGGYAGRQATGANMTVRTNNPACRHDRHSSIFPPPQHTIAVGHAAATA
jgi:hypothetical protein